MQERCTHCRNKVIEKHDGVTKLRIDGAVQFEGDGRATAKCFRCKAEIELPIRLNSGQAGAERVVIVERITRKP